MRILVRARTLPSLGTWRRRCEQRWTMRGKMRCAGDTVAQEDLFRESVDVRHRDLIQTMQLKHCDLCELQEVDLDPHLGPLGQIWGTVRQRPRPRSTRGDPVTTPPGRRGSAPQTTRILPYVSSHAKLIKFFKLALFWSG